MFKLDRDRIEREEALKRAEEQAKAKTKTKKAKTGKGEENEDGSKEN